MQQREADALSLPPLVEGPPRGCLRLSLGPARWAPGAPASLRQPGPLAARLHFWGDPAGGQLLPLPSPPAAAASGSAASAPPDEEAQLSLVLRTGPKYLTRYLRDAGALAISLEPAQQLASSGGSSDGDGSQSAPPAPLALATVGLLALDVHVPVAGDYPLVLPADGASSHDGSSGGGDGAIVGSLPVRLELDYSAEGSGALAGIAGLAPVSSFELQEHLASAEAAAEAAEAAEAEAAVGVDGSGVLAAPAVCCDLAVALADRCATAALAGAGCTLAQCSSGWHARHLPDS